ncbi:MAG: hypothetical protein JW904_12895 [Spirochaetales bacterium]|nr:hypothetical protein [Spirochaetales bacterium]
MNKLTVLVLIGLLAFAVQGFSLKNTRDLAFGVEGIYTSPETFGAMATFHLPGIPLFLAFGANFYNELSGETELTATIDYWLFHTSGAINFYLGLGLYGAMTLDALWYSAGLRLPIGLQIWPANNETVEMFLEVAPAWVPLYASEMDYEKFQAQIALGLRFWFDV